MRTKLISVREACAALNIGRTKCYSLLNDKTLKAVRLGSRRLVLEESVAALIDKLIADEQQ